MKRYNQLLTTSAIGSAVLGTMLLATGGASAATTVAFTALTVPAPALAAASGQLSLVQTNQCIAITGAVANDWTVGSTFQVNLPSGMTFTNAVTANATTGNLTLISGGTAGSSSVTYSIDAAATAGGVVRIGCAAGAGTTTGNLFVTAPSYTATNTTVANFVVTTTGGNSALTGSVVNFLSSAQPVTVTFATGVNQTIDTSGVGLGKGFTTNTSAPMSANRYATLSTAQVIQTASLTNPVGGTAYTVPSTVTETITVTGPFSNINRAYLSTAACVTTAGATPAGTSSIGALTGNTATFSSVSSTANTYNLCIESNGTGILQSGTFTASAISSLSSATILTAGTTNTTMGTLAYSGSPFTVNYATGGSAYQYFLRVTNPNSATGQVFVVVTKEDGTSFSGAITTNLGINANGLYSIADVNTATGANLGAADRARIQMLLSSGMSGTGILFNTATGVITSAN